MTQYIFEESGSTFIPGWVTPKSADKRMDFVARADVGNGLASVKTIILGQAKCEKIDVPTNGQHIARTVARLKRGWVGVYVTTSYFSTSVQEEVIEDHYPIMLINGMKLAETVEKIICESGTILINYLEKLDNQYDFYVNNKRPEEVLNL